MKTWDNAPTPAADEHVLIRQVQQGDPSAFAGLVERYWDRLYRWLYRLSHDRHAAEDLVQETFLKALAKIASFRPDSNFQAWLFRIAHNNWVNQQRTASRQRGSLPLDLPTHDAGPVDKAVHRESLEAVTRTVNRLPDEIRAAFLLRVEDRLSFKDIGKILSITEETARWRIFKARQKLMSVLTRRPKGEVS